MYPDSPKPDPEVVASHIGDRERTLLLLVTNDWYAVSHRLALITAAASTGWRVVVATQVVAHRQVLEDAGAEVLHLAWWRLGDEWRTRNPIALLADIVRTCVRVRPDIVHCVALRPVVFGSVAARIAGIRGIVNAVAGQGFVFVSDSDVARLMRPLVTRVLRLALKPARRSRGRTILQNPNDRDFLVGQGLLEARNVVLIRGAGVDLREFSPSPPPAGEPLVVLPARMLWEKGVAEFVVAARMLRASGVQARFALVGATLSGNRRWVSPEQLAEWQAEGIIEWWGQQNDMPAVLASCRVVALPSYGEGLPKALLEAGAAGRPIVTTDVPGCREIVRDGDNGLLVPPRDAPALAEALRRLLVDQPLQAAMGARGRARVEAEFSVERVVAETLVVYETLWRELLELEIDERTRVQR